MRYTHNFYTLILCSLIFLLPLTSSIIDLGFEYSKLVLFLILASLATLIFISIQKKYTALTPIKKTYFVFLFLLSITSLFGIYPLLSITGEHPYYQGLITYYYLALFTYLISHATQPQKKLIISSVVVSSLLLSLITIKQFILINFLNYPLPTYSGRVVATFGQPNFLAGYLVVTLPFILFFSQKTFLRRLVLVLLLFIQSLAIILTESRASIAILILLLFLFLLNFLGRFIKIFILIISTIALVTSIVLSLYLSTGVVWKELGEPKFEKSGKVYWEPNLTNFSQEKRGYIFIPIIESLKTQPLVGYGLNNLNAQVKKYAPPLENNNPGLYGIKDLAVKSTHVYLLDLVLAGGIPTAVCWILLIAISLLKTKTGILKISLLTYTFWSQFHNQSITNLFLFWLIIGLIDSDANH